MKNFCVGLPAKIISRPLDLERAPISADASLVLSARDLPELHGVKERREMLALWASLTGYSQRPQHLEFSLRRAYSVYRRMGANPFHSGVLVRSFAYI